MPVEVQTYIGDPNWYEVDATNKPGGSESRTEGDDHLRLIKGVIKRSFPNFGETTAEPVTLNEQELNRLRGVPLTDRIIALPPGTKMLFYQDVAPTGWVIDESLDEHILRFTKGSNATPTPGYQGGTRGGTRDFTSLFVDHVESSGILGDHTLTAAQSGAGPHTHPPHRHRVLTEWTEASGVRPLNYIGLSQKSTNTGPPTDPVYSDTEPSEGDPYIEGSETPTNTGVAASEGHSHTLNFAAKFAAVIVATLE